MLYAHDLYGLKVKPLRNAKGTCPFCKEQVIAVCGQINMHHWRHKPNTNCDPWKEHETEWHRKWKNEFPESWQEIIIVEDNEKHIADIKTENGLVIEFQNSSILSETIQIREAFYKNMIWVINADKFKDNFGIWPLMLDKLRILNDDYSRHLDFEYSEIEEADIEFNKKVKDIEREIKNNDNEVTWKIKENIKISEYISDIENTVYIFLQLTDFDTFYFTSQNKNEYHEKCKRKSVLERELKEVKNKVDKYNSLQLSKINNYSTFREIDFKDVNQNSFNICKLYRKDEKNQLFSPNVFSINSESEFRWYSSKFEYQLIIDLTQFEEKLNKRIDKIKTEIKKLTKNNTINIDLFKKEIVEDLNNRNQINLDYIKDYKKENVSYYKKIDKIKKKFSIERIEILKVQAEFHIKDNKVYEKEKAKIKRIYQKRYGYYWNYKRKSWDYSKKPIYLDFGTHLFKIISKNEFQKFDKKDFIKQVLNNTIS